MGWPDNYTLFDCNGKFLSDASRYKVIGNGVVGNVSKWLAKRVLLSYKQ
jgi:site-specific DNA-cytosine methylase